MEPAVSSTSSHALVTSLNDARCQYISDLVAKLRADYDPNLRDHFRVVIQAGLSNGITPMQLADEFAVSTATISRWSHGSVVPGVFVRRQLVDRVEKLLHEQFK